VALPRLGAPWRTTQASTVDLIRRLATHYDDATIAGVLARQHRRTGTGLTFTKARVAEVRRNYRIPPFRKTAAPACHDGHVVSITQAAAELGIGISTIYRWLADGFIAGEQLTPGAPWRIRLDGRAAGQGHRTRARGLATTGAGRRRPRRRPADRFA
jgi:excisionase family DNA binding protein